MKFFDKKNICIGLIIFCVSLYSFADSSYVVKKGDTLYSISKQYKITLAQLRQANNLLENDVIKIGQTLIIPNENSSVSTSKATAANIKEYVVQKGDTLYGISKKYNLTLKELLALNNLDSNSVIKVGQKLKVTGESTKIDIPSYVQTENKKTETKTSEANQKLPDTRTYGNTVTADSSTIWPVKNPTVTTVKGKVNGVQLTAKKDEIVTCVREGSVMYIGLYRGYGQIIFIQSKTGLIYTYAGLNDIKVKKGDYVLFGNELGSAGLDSLTGKSQITFMVFQNGQSIDPAKAPRN